MPYLDQSFMFAGRLSVPNVVSVKKQLEKNGSEKVSPSSWLGSSMFTSTISGILVVK